MVNDISTLPQSHFTWLNGSEVNDFSKPQNILDIDPDGEWGYLFELDLHYPISIHEKTAEFPLAPQHATIDWSMFSGFMKRLHKQLCQDRNASSKFTSTQKLIMDQGDKEAYVVHFRILQFYLTMGLQIKKYIVL